VAIRGVYTAGEEAVLAEFARTAGEMSGWARSLRRRTATEESIQAYANAVDCWNPVWRDNDYAVNTRWGGIIAPPMYQDAFTQVSWMPHFPPELGYLDHLYLGEDWEFFKPVRPGDAFKVWRQPPQLRDITDPEKEDDRKFAFIPHDLGHINQNDELVSTFRTYLEIILRPQPPDPGEVKKREDYKYSREELDYIDSTFKAQQIRGAETRYWENVEAGDELQPVAMGPTTLFDHVVLISGRQEYVLVPMIEMRNRGEMMQLDPDTGVTHIMGWHLSDRMAHIGGEPHALHMGALARQVMARAVTNWMGDDGFLRRFSWRHVTRTAIGDTIIGKGRVVRKRVEEGEHLVDITVWLENLRGNVTEVASATVSLFSRKFPPFSW
jgi:acyl dehydratase